MESNKHQRACTRLTAKREAQERPLPLLWELLGFAGTPREFANVVELGI